MLTRQLKAPWPHAPKAVRQTEEKALADTTTTASGGDRTDGDEPQKGPATLPSLGVAILPIVFTLGILALLGRRVPVSLKIFLTALAIIDDLGAVLIIALFYTAELSVGFLALGAAALAALYALNRRGVARLLPYLLGGALLWVFVLRSGVHATLAGVALAATIPLRPSRGRPDDAESPLHRLEHALQPAVAFLILPVFAFANAGVSFAGLHAGVLAEPVPLVPDRLALLARGPEP